VNRWHKSLGFLFVVSSDHSLGLGFLSFLELLDLVNEVIGLLLVSQVVLESVLSLADLCSGLLEVLLDDHVVLLESGLTLDAHLVGSLHIIEDLLVLLNIFHHFLSALCILLFHLLLLLLLIRHGCDSDWWWSWWSHWWLSWWSNNWWWNHTCWRLGWSSSWLFITLFHRLWSWRLCRPSRWLSSSLYLILSCSCNFLGVGY